MDLINLPYAIRENAAIKNSEYVRFIGRCLTHINESQAQNFQDVWALYETGFKTDGYYVEFGGTDGLTSSNSHLLAYYYDWQGIVSEPNPIWHESLYKNRQKNTTIVTKCVYTETGQTLDFVATKEADLSTIKGFGTDDEHSSKRTDGDVISVETISLYDLLETNNAPLGIDYISVDTEGSEYDILKAFFETNKRYVVKTFTVEHNFNVDFRIKLFKLMSDNGYVRKFPEFSRWDDFYVKGDF